MAKAKEQVQPPMSDQQFFAFLGIAFIIMICIWIYKHEEQIKVSIYNNFIIICFVFYGLLLIGLHLMRRKIASRLSKNRMFHLSKVWEKDDGTFIATTPDQVSIHLPDKTRTGHVQIIGATGRGKTESLILPMMVRDLRRGKSAVLIDGKGDQELARRIKDQSPQVDVMIFDLGNLQDSAKTNPLKVGTSQQITDRLFSSFDFEDEFYRNVQYEITSVFCELLHEQKEIITFKKLYELFMSDERLSELTSKCQNELLVERLVHWMGESRKERDQKTTGIVTQLGQFTRGEIAPLVNGGGDDDFCLGELLSKENQKQFAVIILIPTLLYQEMAFKLGKLFLQEIAWAVAARKERVFTPIYLDEFSSFVYEGFLGILNKARSSGIALHLSHQSLGDLEMVSPEFAKAINTNTNVKCLLGLNDPTTADFFAKHLGTITEQKVTERANEKGILKSREMTGEMSIRDVEAYRIHPNQLKSFTRGKGVIQFHLPEGGEILEVVQFEAMNKEEVINVKAHA